MNRRTFLKFIGGSLAVAAFPAILQAQTQSCGFIPSFRYNRRIFKALRQSKSFQARYLIADQSHRYAQFLRHQPHPLCTPSGALRRALPDGALPPPLERHRPGKKTGLHLTPAFTLTPNPSLSITVIPLR